MSSSWKLRRKRLAATQRVLLSAKVYCERGHDCEEDYRYTCFRSCRPDLIREQAVASVSMAVVVVVHFFAFGDGNDAAMSHFAHHVLELDGGVVNT